jgi:hypothetical protein
MSLFANHGTKLLGTATAVIGALGAIDPVVLTQAIGQRGVAGLTALAGIFTILRGFQNSANQPDPPR